MNKTLNYLTFAGVIAILIVLIVFYQDWRSARSFSPSNTPTNQETRTSGSLNNIFSTSPQVKKSRTNICHEKGVSAHYYRTENYTAYSSIEECLASGGRLPLR